MIFNSDLPSGYYKKLRLSDKYSIHHNSLKISLLILANKQTTGIDS
jgi:hypothetical protein